MALIPGNPQSPFAVVHYFVDEAGNSQQVSAEQPYPTAYSGSFTTLAIAAGTTTVDPGPGIFMGASVVTAGAASTIQFLDGTSAFTPVTTNQAAGAVGLGIPTGIGVRYLTSLVLITAGTAVSTSIAFTA
jgi:hypothetical protein